MVTTLHVWYISKYNEYYSITHNKYDDIACYADCDLDYAWQAAWPVRIPHIDRYVDVRDTLAFWSDL